MSGGFEILLARVGEKGLIVSVFGICLDALPQSQAGDLNFVVMQGLCQVDAHAP